MSCNGVNSQCIIAATDRSLAFLLPNDGCISCLIYISNIKIHIKNEELPFDGSMYHPVVALSSK